MQDDESNSSFELRQYLSLNLFLFILFLLFTYFCFAIPKVLSTTFTYYSMPHQQIKTVPYAKIFSNKSTPKLIQCISLIAISFVTALPFPSFHIRMSSTRTHTISARVQGSQVKGSTDVLEAVAMQRQRSISRSLDRRSSAQRKVADTRGSLPRTRREESNKVTG